VGVFQELIEGVSEYIAGIKVECPRLFYLSESEMFSMIKEGQKNLGKVSSLVAKLYEGIGCLILSS